MPFTINEHRVYRTFALPISAISALKQLKRGWQMKTNAEVLTRLLLAAGNPDPIQGDEYDSA